MGGNKKKYGFDKNSRSTFPYFFAHYFAFQMVALCLHVWKPKYLLHDIEKPWLKLIWKDYKKVQKWHKTHRRHHINWAIIHGFDKFDWEQALIDWECSRYSKIAQQRTARQFLEYLIETNKYGDTATSLLKTIGREKLEQLGL